MSADDQKTPPMPMPPLMSGGGAAGRAMAGRLPPFLPPALPEPEPPPLPLSEATVAAFTFLTMTGCLQMRPERRNRSLSSSTLGSVAAPLWRVLR